MLSLLVNAEAPSYRSELSFIHFCYRIMHDLLLGYATGYGLG